MTEPAITLNVLMAIMLIITTVPMFVLLALAWLLFGRQERGASQHEPSRITWRKV